MILSNYTVENLKKLPVRAIVALSARCARRVEHPPRLPYEHPKQRWCQGVVANAIGAAADVAKGLQCASLDSVVREAGACRAVADGDFVREMALGAVVMPTRAAASTVRTVDIRAGPEQAHMFRAAKDNPFPQLADVTADLAAQDAFMAALEAGGADGHTDTLIKGAVEDYEKLLRLDLGAYPQAEKPIDPSSNGPLGPLDREESLP